VVQNIKPVYYRKHWASIAITLACVASTTIIRIIEIYFDSKNFNQPFELKQTTISMFVFVGILALSYLFYSLATTVRMISISGDRVKFSKVLGSPVTAGIQEISIRANSLSVGKRYTIRLDQIINKEQVKDLLIGHASVVRDNRTISVFRANLIVAAIVVFATLAVFFLAVTVPDLISKETVLYGWAWLSYGFFGAAAAAFFGLAVWNMAVK
jgi:hypothetical protein